MEGEFGGQMLLSGVGTTSLERKWSGWENNYNNIWPISLVKEWRVSSANFSRSVLVRRQLFCKGLQSKYFGLALHAVLQLLNSAFWEQRKPWTMHKCRCFVHKMMHKLYQKTSQNKNRCWTTCGLRTVVYLPLFRNWSHKNVCCRNTMK